MRLFVTEFITSGALSTQPLPPTLQREGNAMLAAVIDDLLGLPDIQILTTLDARLTSTIDLQRLERRLEITAVASPDEAEQAFDACARRADAVLVIAPETDGVLQRQVQRVVSVPVRSLNCSPQAIELCADKVKLAEWLSRRQIATIPTAALPPGVAPWSVFQGGMSPGPCVVKPRDGAGSWLTFAVLPGDKTAWKPCCRQIDAAGMAARMIVQPFVAGTPVSIACLCEPGSSPELFPVGLQRLTPGEFQYQGGRIPARLSGAVRDAVRAVTLAACAAIPGLSGYVGLDLIVPDDPATPPLVVEINPRLTTAYVGYRVLCRDSLAARLLNPGPPLRWREATVEFCPDGMSHLE